MKGKAGGRKEVWITSEIDALVKNNKEAWGRYGQLGSRVSLEDFVELKSTVKRKSGGQKGNRR